MSRVTFMLLTSIWQAVCLSVRKNEKRLSNKWNISQLAAKYQTLLFIDSFFFFIDSYYSLGQGSVSSAKYMGVHGVGGGMV